MGGAGLAVTAALAVLADVRRDGGRIAALLCVALLAVVGCGRSPSVVVYVSADESVARPILAEFEKSTGIRVDPVFDTEATKTTGLAQRLREEKGRPRADVFWSSEAVQTIQLAGEGILAEAHSPALDAWPTQHRSDEGRWFAFAARARVIVYSTERVAKDDAPTTWMQLVQDRWHGRVAMADPRFGTTRTHLGVLGAMWDRRMMPGFLDAWLEGLRENDIALLTSGNGGVVEAIAHGQYDVGMTDTDDVWGAQAQGWKVDLVYPRHVADAHEPGGGTLLIPNTCALVAGRSERQAEAIRLLEYLLSPEVERALMKSPSRNIPLGPALADEAATLLPPDPFLVDWARAAEASDRASNHAATVLRAPREKPIGRPASVTDDAEGGSEDDPPRGAPTSAAPTGSAAAVPTATKAHAGDGSPPTSAIVGSRRARAMDEAGDGAGA